MKNYVLEIKSDYCRLDDSILKKNKDYELILCKGAIYRRENEEDIVLEVIIDSL